MKHGTQGDEFLQQRGHVCNRTNERVCACSVEFMNNWTHRLTWVREEKKRQDGGIYTFRGSKFREVRVKQRNIVRLEADEVAYLLLLSTSGHNISDIRIPGPMFRKNVIIEWAFHGQFFLLNDQPIRFANNCTVEWEGIVCSMITIFTRHTKMAANKDTDDNLGNLFFGKKAFFANALIFSSNKDNKIQ